MREFVRFRVCLACAMAVAVLAGCAKAPEGEQAEFALGDKPGQYMPPARTAADLTPLMDQTSVTVGKKIEIKYGPLKKPAGDGDSKKGAKGGKKPAGKPAKASAKKTTDDTGEAPRKRTKIGQALSGAMGMLSRKGPAVSPSAAKKPVPGEEEDEEDAPPKAVKAEKAKLEDPRDPMQEMPAPSKEYSPDQIKAVQAAARAEAIKNLMRIAYAMPLDPTQTVGEAIGQAAEKFPTEAIVVRVVGASWTDEETFEVEVQVNTGDLINAMANTFDGVTFDPLRDQLAVDKAISAKGSSTVPGIKKPAGGPAAKPGSKKSKKGSGTG